MDYTQARREFYYWVPSWKEQETKSGELNDQGESVDYLKVMWS